MPITTVSARRAATALTALVLAAAAVAGCGAPDDGRGRAAPSPAAADTAPGASPPVSRPSVSRSAGAATPAPGEYLTLPLSASGRVPVLRHGPRTGDGGDGGDGGEEAAGPGGTAGRASGDRVVALTFDAALSPEDAKRAAEGGVRHDNPELFAALRRAKAPATVFMTGAWARTHRDRARAIGRDRLFEVGNLSRSHRAFTPDCAGLPALAPGRHLAEVRDGLKEIRAAGVSRPTPYFRFPGGCHDDRSRRAVAPAGVTAVAGDVDAADTDASDPEELAGRVLEKVRPGSVVVLRWDRERAPATAEAVGRLVPELRERGYRLVRVSELVAAAMGRAPAPSPAPASPSASSTPPR